MRDVRLKIGMVFQEGALFDSLTVGENVGYRLVEDGQLDEGEIEERVREMLGFVGLAPFYERMPSELSGRPAAAGGGGAGAGGAAADHALRRAHHRPRPHHRHQPSPTSSPRCATSTASPRSW